MEAIAPLSFPKVIPGMAEEDPVTNPALARMGAALDHEWLARGGPDVGFDEFLNVTDAQQVALKEWIAPLIDGDRSRARKPDADKRRHPSPGAAPWLPHLHPPWSNRTMRLAAIGLNRTLAADMAHGRPGGAP